MLWSWGVGVRTERRDREQREQETEGAERERESRDRGRRERRRLEATMEETLDRERADGRRQTLALRVYAYASEEVGFLWRVESRQREAGVASSGGAGARRTSECYMCLGI